MIKYQHYINADHNFRLLRIKGYLAGFNQSQGSYALRYKYSVFLILGCFFSVMLLWLQQAMSLCLCDFEFSQLN